MLTTETAYLNSILMSMICHAFNWLLFRPVNDRLCALEMFSDDYYYRRRHNILIIKWICLQGIRTFMVTVVFSRQGKLTII